MPVIPNVDPESILKKFYMLGYEVDQAPYNMYVGSTKSDIFVTQDTTVQLYSYKDGKEIGQLVDFKSGTSFSIVGRNQDNTNEFLIKYGNYYAFISAPNTADAAINGQGTASNAWLNSHPTLQFDPDADNATNFNLLVAEANDDIARSNAYATESQQTETPQNTIDITNPQLAVRFDAYNTNENERVVPYDIPKLTPAKQSAYDKIIASYGTPPQWTRYVDPRIYTLTLDSPGTSSKDVLSEVFGVASAVLNRQNFNRSKINVALGRRYTTVIISNPTIIELAPGYIKYSEWLGTDGFVDAVENYNESADPTDLIDIFSGRDSKFYTIEPCFSNSNLSESASYGYITYVNALLYIAAIFLSRAKEDVGETRVVYHSSGIRLKAMPAPLSQRMVPNTSTKYSEINWERYDKASGYINIGGRIIGTAGRDMGGSDRFDYINFYLSGSTNANDNFETQVEESTLGNLANTVNAALKETAYWTNGTFIDDAKNKLDEIFNGNTLNGVKPLNGVFNIAEMIGGAKLVFPKIITESSYGKSIQCECTFVGLYGDEEALYLNTLVPYFHLLAFVLPHQVKSSLEMYTFPFLVKAFCRGLFNVEMGVISSFSVQRGGNDQALWSYNGTAELITVSFEVTPLLTNLVMSSESDGLKWIMRNKGLQEYMSTIAAFDARNDKYDLALEIWEGWKGRGAVAKAYSFVEDDAISSNAGKWVQGIIATLMQGGGVGEIAYNAVHATEENFKGFISGLSF